MTLSDRDAVQAQIGRPPRATPRVMQRCSFALPIVVAMPPQLENGEPFPTRYWLSCPLACKRIARIEAQGGVQQANARLQSDPEFAQAFETRNAAYAIERNSEESVPALASTHKQGVGGTARSVKCLHAHFADFAAGNPNPVGALIATQVQPVQCSAPCVQVIDSKPSRNRDWVEPR